MSALSAMCQGMLQAQHEQILRQDQNLEVTCAALPGTQAPEALAAPRHKIAMQKRRSAKKSTAKKNTAQKASKTRAFAQPGADPRKALWHPPASPYGLIEEYLYEDPWKLLVACMLLNVTAGKQVWCNTGSVLRFVCAYVVQKHALHG